MRLRWALRRDRLRLHAAAGLVSVPLSDSYETFHLQITLIIGALVGPKASDSRQPRLCKGLGLFPRTRQRLDAAIFYSLMSASTNSIG